MVDWKMYSEIQRLKNKGLKKTQTARKLDINRETVMKYWDMPPDEYAELVNKHRARKADVYRELIIEWLTEYPDITAAQMYDWCKEHSQLETLDFQKRSFRDYVKSIREEYDIPKPEHQRQYEAVDDPPMGKQGQVDMGEISLMTTSGRHRKIYCFAMVLSNSRYKYVLWQLKPFTTDSFIRAHIKAFAYFGGRPEEIVYDQDKVLAVSENNGDIIYTAGFQNYVNEVKFDVFLCHGSDPESKGRVENVVKYAKHGFAEHRVFDNIDDFNEDCLAWLKRTANRDVHGTTHKRPDEVFALEKEYLIPVSEYSFETADNESISYPIRKDNIVLYKGNRYRVPKGTYSKDKRVYMVVDDDAGTIAITDMITGEVYATHPICHEKGKLIGDKTRNMRDKTTSILEQEETLKKLFDDDSLVGPFLDHIHQEKPRYYRDQLGVIRKLFEEWNKEDIEKGIKYCCERELYSAGELRSTIIYLTQADIERSRNKKQGKSSLPEKYRGDRAEIRDLREYEDAMEMGGVANG